MFHRLSQSVALAVVLLTMPGSAFGNNVQVTYRNGDIFVAGDSLNNEIQISKSVGNNHVFRGLNGTTVNGSSKTLVLPIFDDLRIYLGDGHDVVDIRSAKVNAVSHASLDIKLGNGNDTLFLQDVTVADDVWIDTDVAGSFGNDHVEIDNLISGEDIEVQMFEGVDNFRILYSRAGIMTVVADDAATMLIQKNNCRIITVDAGRFGRDDITIVSNETTGISLDTSNEGDDVMVLDNTISRWIGNINLWGGNDDILFRYNRMGFFGPWPGFYFIDTGTGTDSGLIHGTSYWDGVIPERFEGTVR